MTPPLLDATEVPWAGPSASSWTSGDEERAWQGAAEQLAVMDRVVRPDPAERFSGVGELAAAWRRSLS
ncbi:hypothetical protein ACFYOA_06710 [Streptomyces iakyrus]|uniref:hypothetical protein n=1 Tax=Streptomyces iakyrus TaxID=68219 RepID=UPI0036956AC3